MLCFDFWPPLYFYVSFGVFGVMSILVRLRLSRGVHGKLFDGLVFLGGYQGLHYIHIPKALKMADSGIHLYHQQWSSIPAPPPSDEVHMIFILGLLEEVATCLYFLAENSSQCPQAITFRKSIMRLLNRFLTCKYSSI